MDGTDSKDGPDVGIGLRRGAIVFVMFWLVFAGVHHDEPGWNVNSRFALTRAIVDKGTFIVDGYVDAEGRDTFTEDRAIYGGHYYSDKIIGTSLLGLPAYALTKLGFRLAGGEPPVPLARYLTTIGSVGVCAALAATAMLSLLLAFGATRAEAFLLTLALSFGTMLWSYSSLFYSYLPAVCFALFAYNVLLRARLAADGIPVKAMALAGVSIGAALLCEYTVGIVAVALGLYALFHAWPRRTARADADRNVRNPLPPDPIADRNVRAPFPWGILVFGACAAAVLSVFAAYTLICFHELCVPYKYLENRQFATGMSQGLQGIAAFKLSTLYYITVHPFRGLFVLSPVLALAPIGMIRMALKDRRFSSDALLCGAIFVGYLLFNSSYYMWWGGWAMGPRHLIPGLPFLIPPLLWIVRWNKLWAALFGALLAASIWLVAVPTLVDPQVPQGYSTEELLSVGDDAFLPAEIVQPQALLERLRVGGDPLSAHLRSRLSPSLSRLVNAGAEIAPPDDYLRWALAEELNRQVRGGALYTAERFAGVELDRRTRELIEQHPLGPELGRLNRMLMQQAYRDAIAPRGLFFSYKSPVLEVCWPAFFRGGAAWNRSTPYGLRGPAYFLILAAVWIGGSVAFLKSSREKQA